MVSVTSFTNLSKLTSLRVKKAMTLAQMVHPALKDLRHRLRKGTRILRGIGVTDSSFRYERTHPPLFHDFFLAVHILISVSFY